MSVVVKVLIAGRVAERLQLFDLHRSCAKLAVGPEIGKRKRKYEQRDVVIQHELADNSADR